MIKYNFFSHLINSLSTFWTCVFLAIFVQNINTFKLHCSIYFDSFSVISSPFLSLDVKNKAYSYYISYYHEAQSLVS